MFNLGSQAPKIRELSAASAESAVALAFSDNRQLRTDNCLTTAPSTRTAPPRLQCRNPPDTSLLRTESLHTVRLPTRTATATRYGRTILPSARSARRPRR